MIDEADRDGDGEISQEEFLRIMKKTVRSQLLFSTVMARLTHSILPNRTYINGATSLLKDFIKL